MYETGLEHFMPQLNGVLDDIARQNSASANQSHIRLEKTY